jgi:hypothetical protein
MGVILRRFEASGEQIADEIADASMKEVPAFAEMNDPRLHAEIRALAAEHVGAFTLTARTGEPPAEVVLRITRDRAVMRARQMVPLSAMLHSHLIAQRVISAALTQAADNDVASRGAALVLIARTFDYNIAVTGALTEAYLEVVQGDLVDLNVARRAVVDATLAGNVALPELTRRATSLGFVPDRRYRLALGRLSAGLDGLGDASRAIARATGRVERQAFVVLWGDEILALLDADGPRRATAVLAEALETMHAKVGLILVGVGQPFCGLAELPGSYRDAQRALRHATAERPIITAPDDVRLFDELTVARDDATELIPAAVRATLAEAETHQSLEAFVSADMKVADAARNLNLHPNSLRYRLRRIAHLTGLDPTRLSELLELVTASRLLQANQEVRPAAEPGRSVENTPVRPRTGDQAGQAARPTSVSDEPDAANGAEHDSPVTRRSSAIRGHQRGNT